MDKSPSARARARAGARNGTRNGAHTVARSTAPQLFDDAAGSDTRAKILAAAFRRLATEGYAALSVREIARDAGVNHALINYHFRSKDQLVIDVLDAVNQRRYAKTHEHRFPGAVDREQQRQQAERGAARGQNMDGKSRNALDRLSS